MKTAFYITLIAISTIGCQKEENKILSTKENSNKFTYNLPVIIHASEKMDVRASDLETSNRIIKRKIELIDRASNKIIDSFIISMYQTDTTKNLLTSLKLKEFSGELTIESDDLIPLKIKFEKASSYPTK